MSAARFAFALLAALFAATPLCANVLADQPYRIGPDARVATDVFVDGKGPFNFLLDTAASRTMMFEHLRAQLGLDAADGGPLTVVGMQNVGTAVPVQPSELRLSNEAIHGLTVGVLPDDADAPDGLLGMDALANYLVVLDRRAMRLKLLTPDQSAVDPYRDWPSAQLTPRPVRNTAVNFWTVGANINGAPMTTLLDMGSGITMLNWAAAERLGLKRTNFPRDGVPQKLRDALGTLEPVVLVNGLNIRLGGQVFSNQTALVANARVFGYFNLKDGPAAIIGPGLLKDNSLAIDFAGHRLYLGPQTR